MNHLLLGLFILVFGVLIGGVGIASAGVGIGIPMIPLGIYMTYRGWRIYKHSEKKNRSELIDFTPIEPLEKTKHGKIALGIILIMVGIGTSAVLIGIPVMVFGVWVIYRAVFNKMVK